jgi:hypothetical protein
MSRPRFVNRLNLAALPIAVSCSRVFTKLTLTRWGATFIVDDALLVVSELVTNAVQATGITDPHPRWSELGELNLVGVNLLGFDASIVIEVWDCDPHPPIMKSEDLYAESGRGLHLVAQVAQRWGSYPTRGGKVVWADLSLYPKEEASGQSREPRAPLPRRKHQTWPKPERPVAEPVDPELLRRVVEGLRNLGGEQPAQ